MLPTVIMIAAFVGVAALVGGVAVLFRGDRATDVENRLDVLTGAAVPESLADKRTKDGSVLAQPLETRKDAFERFVSRFCNPTLLLEQADVRLTPSKLLMMSGGLALVGAVVCVVAGLHYGLAVVAALVFSVLPFMWVLFRRKQRLAKFGKQLPDTLELISRALRAGHSLAAGCSLVADQMDDPIAAEFGRVYEEQNLGIPFDEALGGMTKRIPNLDLQFFCTAVILQRQTGGDLAEILDKIGHLVRERFKVWGTVQALTGEGRLSGIVLLALPPVLFVTMYRLNPDYINILFEDPMGNKMLAGAIVLQIVGALVIKKIINIKV